MIHPPLPPPAMLSCPSPTPVLGGCFPLAAQPCAAAMVVKYSQALAVCWQHQADNKQAGPSRTRQDQAGDHQLLTWGMSGETELRSREETPEGSRLQLCCHQLYCGQSDTAKTLSPTLLLPPGPKAKFPRESSPQSWGNRSSIPVPKPPGASLIPFSSARG